MAIVNIYRVTWHNNRHNQANQQTNMNLVASASADATAIASTIQTNNGDNKNVTIESIALHAAGVIQ